MTELTPNLLALQAAELLEREDFRRWALRPGSHAPAGYPEIEAALAILTGLHDDAGLVTPNEAEKASDFAALMDRLSATTLPPTSAPAAPTRHLWQKLWPAFAVAAAVAGLLLAGVLLLQNTAPAQYATGNGERLKLELPDGTEVILNANSRLTLAGEDWGGHDRLVRLEGEAFFNVTKSDDAGVAKAFIVQTDDLTVRVLGTRFNVRERRGQSGVFLEEGNVRVTWSGTDIPETELLPGELIIRKAADQLPAHYPVSAPDNVLSWRKGRLTFDQTPLREALNELNDIYGIELRCQNDTLLDRKISSAGIPTDNQSLALQLMEKALGLRIEQLKDITYEVTAAE